MLAAIGTWTKMGDELIHKRGEVLMECIKEGSKGDSPMYINSTHFPKISIDI
jgi:hypothetical protein